MKHLAHEGRVTVSPSLEKPKACYDIHVHTPPLSSLTVMRIFASLFPCLCSSWWQAGAESSLCIISMSQQNFLIAIICAINNGKYAKNFPKKYTALDEEPCI